MDGAINQDTFEWLKGKKVLIIEDDTLLQDLLANKLADLRSHGLEVYPVFDGRKALEVTKKEKPDIIILDLMLPGVTGFEFLEALRKDEETKDSAVIVLSNLNQDSDKEKAMKLGVKEYLVKADISLDSVSEKIAELLKG
ncbi:MAG: response regulator [Candidatus Zambryskibacteria bacterium CG_4_9_14_3_um_filter_42_9]|uniref:Response regulator n=1 Tax=Candidatus Zambryskibacteria bacterium CG22_combo_CG10-13_8_21_14_all_42_17 TaxID=1975118 RepID=A0A2H0BEM3_9BACT|nr:MAG: response regulator [Candidatus Zambryskibacteria bacterium CG22_combo_CG10-13_8_21_14_all_42_17]PJA37016.1 MAG: response regulator [Candidatus Zambryskibacteria bacterium CG_4_9_14_3_um_filter_42_9]